MVPRCTYDGGKGGQLMKKVIACLILLFCLVTGMACEKGQAGREYVPVTVYDPNRDAAKDIELAIVEAQRSGKFILLDIGGDWCIWCRKLNEFFSNNEDINNFMHKNYVLVKINYSPDNRNKEVLSRYPEISGYPHLFVLDKTGKLIHSQNTTYLEEDENHDRGKVFQFLKKWAPNIET